MVRWFAGGVGLLFVLGGYGCSTVPATAAFWEEAERRDEATRCLNLGIQALREGDRDRADPLLDLAVSLQDNEGEGVVPVTERLLAEGKPDSVVPLLMRVIQQVGNGENPYLYGALARYCSLLDYQSDAERYQKHAEQLVRSAEELLGRPAPLNEAERLERVRLLAAAGRYCERFGKQPEKAVRLLRKAVGLGAASNLTERDRRAWSALGLVLAQHPEHALNRDEASRLTRQAAQSDPTDPELLHAHGFALLAQGELVGAQRVLREAADLDPNHAELRCHLGQAYARQQLYVQAAQEFDRALLLHPRLALALKEKQALPRPLPAQANLGEEALY